MIEHDIDVGDAKPVRQRFYRVSLDKRKSLDSSVQYLLDNGLAVPSYSSWASPCLLVKKSDSSFRFCTDYRKVNTVTKIDDFPFRFCYRLMPAKLVRAQSQKDNTGVDRPVCFFSRKFNKNQLNYSTIEKEGLALIWALQHFNVYVGGGLHPVVVFTDHNPLTFIQSLQNSNQRLMR